MEFIEAPAFTKHLSKYLVDDDFKELQRRLRLNPQAGDIIQGTGGFRKIRWMDPRRGKGKRGGLRVIYMKKNKRSVFGDLMGGIAAMKKHRMGRITLRTHKSEPFTLPKVEGNLIRDTRKRLGLSQSLFAEVLHMNPRTLANWEQDHSKPNEQAAALILLVRKFPDPLKRLRKLAA